MSREFARALLLAALIHLAAGTIFVITVPIAELGDRLSEISFLGTLHDDTLEVRTEKISYRDRLEKPMVEVEIPVTNFSEERVFVKLEKKGAPFSTSVGGTKKIPDFSREISLPEPEEDFPEIIDGPVKNRTVLYQPPVPAYPSWAQGRGLDFDVELKFRVRTDGRVSYAEPVISSGYPEVDLVAIKYIKNWRFNSLPEGQKEEQWGRIKLQFRLK